MAEDFFLVTGACFVSGETKPSGRFVVATSEVAAIEHGHDDTSVIVLIGGERFCVLEPYDELSAALALQPNGLRDAAAASRAVSARPPQSRVTPDSFARSR